MKISEMQEQAHRTAEEKGFHERPREFGTLIALIHSELSEALEAHRQGDFEGIAEELADVLIRIGDLCGEYTIDLEGAIARKMQINKGRAYKHGKRY